jgi:hypothetical protein
MQHITPDMLRALNNGQPVWAVGPGLNEQGCGQDLEGGEQVNLCHMVLELVLGVAVEGLHCHGPVLTILLH